MMRLNYMLMDVFTKDRLTGNPLAVVTKADGLLDDQMQRIASEFNLSETVFISRPRNERHTAALRIFTPAVELAFAGHPTVGAAVALGLELRTTAIRIEEKVGLITCVIDKVDKSTGYASFGLPHLPVVAGKTPDKLRIAAALGIEPEDINFGEHRPGVYSGGTLFYTVPVRDASVLKWLSPQRQGWVETFPLEHNAVYAYTETPDEEGFDLAARMFAPGMGLGEDPATGAAAAALIGELARHAGEGQSEYQLRQGHEMGRPSQITIQLRKTGDELTHGAIGGHAVIVGQGWIEI